MPVPSIGLEDRVGVEPTFAVLRAAAFTTQPTIHVVKREGIEPSSSDLQSVESPGRRNLLVSTHGNAPHSPGLQPGALTFMLRRLVRNQRFELCLHAPKARVLPLNTKS